MANYIPKTRAWALNEIHCMLQEAQNGNAIDYDEAFALIESVRDDGRGNMGTYDVELLDDGSDIVIVGSDDQGMQKYLMTLTHNGTLYRHTNASLNGLQVNEEGRVLLGEDS